MSNDGNLFARLGQVHIQREQWAEAERALREGMDKGGLEDEGEEHLYMGIALLNQDRLRDAREWFTRAMRDREQRDFADDYIKPIARKLKQQRGGRQKPVRAGRLDAA